MKTQNLFAMKEQGPIVAFALVDPTFDPATPNRGGDENLPEEEIIPDDEKGIENLPPEQPDVDPLEREEPELDEIDENQPNEQPDIDSDLAVEPGTNPMGRDHSQFI